MKVFEVGDKVVCLNNSNLANNVVPLTCDKVYEVTEFSDVSGLIRIINDNNYSTTYSVTRFVSIEEYRANTINNILK